MLKLGRLTLDAPFFQAPLSGYSDYPMRKLARSFGAPLTFAGVMLAKSAISPRVLRKPAFRPHDDEHPIGAQILGSDPKIMAKAAKALTEAGYDLIDLNFACPAPKVLRRQRGGFLLTEPAKAIEIYRSVRDAVSCPVLIKLRTGYDSDPASLDNFWHIASEAAEDGLDALVVHGRTVTQRFTGTADWQLLAELKHRLPKTTIIGSGDLFDAKTIAHKIKSTGLDGASIARGAIGNPWLFAQLRQILQGKPAPDPPTLTEQGRIILKHFESLCRCYKTPKNIRLFRKFIVGYCKMHPERKKAQTSLLAAKTAEKLISAIENYYCLH